jgi:adenylylsulfate kinase-like enzyme
MARLRVRSGADIHLADAFDAPGCPLCRERRRTEAAYLESILAESVNDIAYRQGLDAARGFCGRHSRAFLDADRARAGSLGAAILLRATLVARLRDVEAAAGARGWSRARKVADARRPPACPACERVALADGRSVETVVRLAEDPAWAEAAARAPFCLDHLLALMDVRPVPAWWAAVEARHVERLQALRDRLERFAHASAHDRRQLQTDDQRASVDEAADLLGGARVAPGAVGRMAAAPASPAGARAVLLTGVFGSGKTTLAVELLDRLADAGAPAAAIDLDWLGWHGVEVGWDEHEDPRLTLEHLAAMAARYAALGVERLVLAGSMPEGTRERYAAAVGMPLTVVELRVTPEVVRRRLEGDPNGSRADDLARSLERLSTGPSGDPGADWSVDADAPVAELATAVLRRLDWLPDDPAGGAARTG